MKIKNVQSVCLILACVAATGLTGCGKQIQDLYKEGYDAVGTGNNYPYVLASPMELENGEEILKAFEQSVSGDYDEKNSKITAG